MSIICKELDFDDGGVAVLIFKNDGSNEHHYVYCRDTVLRDTKGYDRDWKTHLDGIVRGEILSHYYIIFRTNMKHRRITNRSDSGNIAINEYTKSIIANGNKVPDSLYDEVLLWFHRLMTIANRV